VRTNGVRAWSLTAAVILLAPTGSVGLAGAPARPAADSVAEGARKIVQSVQEAAKGLGKTLTEGATEVEQRAEAGSAESRPAGEKLEKSAQASASPSGMGMKFVARSLQSSSSAAKLV
jgi:hypothetical protein